MDTIGAEAAKLAGLQMDLLAKYRAEQLTLGHIEWFLGLKKIERDALVVDGKLPPKAVRAEKFEVLADLGVITVPEDHVSSMVFCGLNFSNPSSALKAGDKLLVKVHRQNVPGRTTSRDRMTYLERRNDGNIYLGAQGIVLVLARKKDKLPKGWHTSFDKKKNLPVLREGGHMLPVINARSDGGFHVDLVCLEGHWNDVDTFLSFSCVVE